MNIGTRVLIDDVEPRAGVGVVAGFGHCMTTGGYDDDDRWVAPTIQPTLLVRLYRGFYSPQEDIFIDVLAVHPDNAKEIA